MKNDYKSWMNLDPAREEGLSELYSSETISRCCRKNRKNSTRPLFMPKFLPIFDTLKQIGA